MERWLGSLPAISVIVGAYTRSRYLMERSRRSVLEQTIDPNEIEILVTKGFENPEIDRFLESAGSLPSTIASLEWGDGLNAIEHTQGSAGRDLE